jgi:hypothetical protein
MPSNLGEWGLVLNFLGAGVLFFMPLRGKVTTWKSLESILVIYSKLAARIGFGLVAIGFLLQYLNGKI